MKHTLEMMILQAERDDDYSLLGYADSIIEILEDTINAPSNWRSIGREFEEKYRDNSFVYDGLHDPVYLGIWFDERLEPKPATEGKPS